MLRSALQRIFEGVSPLTVARELLERSNPEPRYYWLLVESHRGLASIAAQVRAGGIVRLSGVKGVSGTGEIVWDHGHVREVAFRLNGRVFRRFNKSAMIDYDDVGMLLADNGRVLRRILMEGDRLGGMFGKAEKYIVRALGKGDRDAAYRIEYAGLIGNGFGYWLDEQGGAFAFDDLDDVMDIMDAYARSDHYKASDFARMWNEVDKRVFRAALEQGLVDQAKLYEDEQEWLLDEDLQIPRQGTVVYVKKDDSRSWDAVEQALKGDGSELRRVREFGLDWTTGLARKLLAFMSILKSNRWDVRLIDAAKFQKAQVRFLDRRMRQRG